MPDTERDQTAPSGPVRGPRKTWTLPIGEPNVGLTVTLSYGDPGGRWGACWYGCGVAGYRTPWGALWAAWRWRRAHHRAVHGGR